MAKNFGNAPGAKVIGEVAKQSAQKATVVTVRNIEAVKLHDFAKNGEDILDTADLEKSISEIGFTDPIEVTNFGCIEGEYTIVSGHRRRAAGVKCGMTSFPCIVKSFQSEDEVRNYVLFANSQRDSSKDPLLYAKRYIMHKEYLKEIGFAGSIREEVAKRLGLSVQQGDRYAAMSKIIAPVWDLVKDEKVGMTSVQPLAVHPTEEQLVIYEIMVQALDSGVSLTRDTVKSIVDGYRAGKRTWNEINEVKPVLRDSGIPLNATMNTEPSESREEAPQNRNDEVRREFDPIAAEADAEDAARAEAEREQEATKKGKNPPLTEEEKQFKRGEDISKYIEKLQTCFSDLYTFPEHETAESVMKNMETLVEVIVDELYSIGREYNKSDLFKSLKKDIIKKAKEYDGF